MYDCNETKPLLSRSLEGALDDDSRTSLERHVAACDACAEELELLRAVYRVLPPGGEVDPPAEVRRRVLAKAHEALGPAATQPITARVAFRVGTAAVLATLAATLAVKLFTLRGAMAPLNDTTVLALTVLFAALVATAAGGVFRTSLPTPIRGALSGSLGGLAGYALISLALPISHTVNYCGDLVFGNIHLSLGQLCTVYLGVTAGYAAIPMAVVSFSRHRSRPKGPGLVEAMIFSGLALPILLMQSGVRVWLIPVSVALGFLIGALLGELLGRRARALVTGAG